MSEHNVPAGWTHCALGEYLYLKNGFAFKSTSYIEQGQNTAPIIRISDIDGRFSDDSSACHVKSEFLASGFEVEKGDLLIAMSGATTGKIGIYKGNTPAYQNQRVGNIKLINKDLGNLAFRNYLIHYLSADILKEAYGGAQPNISGTAIENIQILLPPLAEQTRIAQKLDELLAQVDTLKARLDAIPALLKRFRQSTLAAAVSGRLTADWREGNPAEADSAAANGVSQTQAKLQIENSNYAWPVVRLGSVARGFAYGSSSKSQSDGLVPVLRMGNIQSGKLDWSNLVYSSDPKEIEKYLLEYDDVLFNRTNSPELVGKTSIYKGEQKAIYAGYLIRVRCTEHLLPNFLNYCLNSLQAKDYCWRVKTDGVSQSNINAKKLADFPMGLPTVQEQTEIVRRVEQLFAFTDQLEAKIKTAQARVNHLTQSILAKAFRGELVPQDPNDEPASELLARIKAQRATAPKAKRGRKASA